MKRLLPKLAQHLQPFKKTAKTFGVPKLTLVAPHGNN